MQPRLIRLRDVPDYLGMDMNRFNKEVRPHLVVIPIGKQGIAFDRLDLDAWVEHYKQRNGRPATQRRKTLWDVKDRQGFSNVERLGTLINKSSVDAFEKALQQVTLLKRKVISQDESKS